MKIVLAIAALLACGAPCRAASADNDYLQDAGGTLQPLPGEGRQVRLVREVVRSEVFADHVSTLASYELRNEGPARAVGVAFPESDAGPEFSRFQSISLSLDGRPTKARRVLGRARGDEGRPSRWQARVPFARGQSRTVRVRLRCGTENLLHGGEWGYRFQSGGWRGRVEQSLFSLTFRAPGTYDCGAHLSNSADAEGKAVGIKRSGTSLIFERGNWQPRGDFLFTFDPTFAPGWLSYEGLGKLRHSVTVPGEPRGVEGVGFWLPPALVRGGVTFVSLDELDSRLTGRRVYEGRTKLDWDGASKIATLRGGKHTLRFQAGRKAMRVDGRLVALSSAPFLEEGSGHDMGGYSYFYVPLAPILRVLGGTSNVNAPSHRIAFSGPLFRKPTED